MPLAIVTAISYLLGSIPFSMFIASLYKKDLRKMGTGNIGTANVYRATGRIEAALLALIGDMGKGALAVIMTQKMTSGSQAALALAVFFVVAGHNWPVFLGFRGGRGLATLGGALLILNWRELGTSLIIIILSILLMDRLTGRWRTLSKESESLLPTMTSQVAGRMVGIGLSIVYLEVFNPSVLIIISGGLALVIIKHIERTQKFIT